MPGRRRLARALDGTPRCCNCERHTGGEVGFAGINQAEDSAIRGFLDKCPAYPLDDEVIKRAISLRRQRKMRLGDSIIAATAMLYGLSLVTPNEGDFKHIPGLKLINPFAASP